MKRKIGVLIVDDEVLVRIGIIHAVACEENGFEIIGEASDGESCLQMARKYQPDLIVLDINMPGMNGLQVLNRLKEEGYSGKVIMLTCYEEFEYVREALRGGADDYVLKSNLNESSILSAILRLDFNRRPEEEEPRNRKMMAEKYLRQKIEGFSFGETQELTFRTSCFCAIAGKIRDMEKIERRYEQQGMELFYRSFYSILEQALQHYQEYDVIQYTKETVGIFISFSDTGSMQEIHMRVRRLIPHIYNIVQNYLDLDMIIGVSSLHYGEEKIREAWNQAYRMLDRSFFDKKTVYFYEDLRDYYLKAGEFDGKLTEIENSLKECVVDGKTEEIRERMQEYFEEIRNGKIAEPQRIRVFCQDIVKLLQAQERNWQDAQILEILQKQESLEEMESQVYIWLDSVIPEKTDQSTNWLVRRACDYIREHYRQDISLSDIAAYLELSESYASRIFNKHMGKNIPAYINQLRIEEARELLKNTNKKIYEVATEVGYTSTTAFHMAFKKQEGITPIEYRNQGS